MDWGSASNFCLPRLYIRGLDGTQQQPESSAGEMMVFGLIGQADLRSSP